MQMDKKIITASEGMMLTNGIAFAKTVALGIADRAENWSEITLQEYYSLTKSEE